MSILAESLNNSPARCGVPPEAAPNLSCPGCDFASLIRSSTDFTGSDGCTTIRNGARASGKPYSQRLSILPSSASLVGVAGHLAVEHAHHRREEQALTLRARVAVVHRGGLHLPGDRVGQDLEGLPGAHREHLRPA